MTTDEPIDSLLREMIEAARAGDKEERFALATVILTYLVRANIGGDEFGGAARELGDAAHALVSALDLLGPMTVAAVDLLTEATKLLQEGLEMPPKDVLSRLIMRCAENKGV